VVLAVAVVLVLVAVLMAAGMEAVRGAAPAALRVARLTTEPARTRTRSSHSHSGAPHLAPAEMRPG
jgi:hypothetical protein